MGVIFGALALQAVLDNRPDIAIIWLMATMVVDAVDGPVARALGVKEKLPQIDGYVLDLVIDYVTCVIVPAAFMYQFDVVPRNAFGLAVLGFMVLTSAIWFSRTDMMTDDNFFRGFPAAWNMVGPLLWVIQANEGFGAAMTILFSVLSLTNMPYPHIVRAKFLRPLTLVAAVVWLGGLAARRDPAPAPPDLAARCCCSPRWATTCCSPRSRPSTTAQRRTGATGPGASPDARRRTHGAAPTTPSTRRRLSPTCRSTTAITRRNWLTPPARRRRRDRAAAPRTGRSRGRCGGSRRPR